MSNIIDLGVLYGADAMPFSTFPRATLIRLTIAVLAFWLAGCAALPERCPAGQSPMTEAELFFGLSIPAGGVVSEAEWQRFADEEITSRFPDGLTIEDAHGQWKGAGRIAREGAKHLIIVLPARQTGKLDAIRAAYKNRFHQESVLLIETRVCGSF